MSLLETFRIPALDALLPTFKASAAKRDLAGGHPAEEKALLRAQGLLKLAIPKAFGGDELAIKPLYQSTRHLAATDSALAHILAFHHLQVLTIRFYGNPAQNAQLLSQTVDDGLWWGNAMNPVDLRLSATKVEGGYRLNGVKGFCSGSRGSDWMTFSARVSDNPNPLIGVLPSCQTTPLDDWNPIGQRQTDSVSVRFDDVFVPFANILKDEHKNLSPWQSLRTCLAQFVLVNLYLGMAEGALAEGCDFINHHAFAWPASGLSKRADDPFQQNRIGQLAANLQGAKSLADRAADILQLAFARGDALTQEERGEVAIAVAEAKVLAHQISLSATSELFEMTGAKGTQQNLGLDRFWRNARTHTLHDPLDYKLNQIGRWHLLGAAPDPKSYS